MNYEHRREHVAARRVPLEAKAVHARLFGTATGAAAAARARAGGWHRAALFRIPCGSIASLPPFAPPAPDHATSPTLDCRSPTLPSVPLSPLAVSSANEHRPPSTSPLGLGWIFAHQPTLPRHQWRPARSSSPPPRRGSSRVRGDRRRPRPPSRRTSREAVVCGSPGVPARGEPPSLSCTRCAPLSGPQRDRPRRGPHRASSSVLELAIPFGSCVMSHLRHIATST